VADRSEKREDAGARVSFGEIAGVAPSPWAKKVASTAQADLRKQRRASTAAVATEEQDLPPQTVLSRVVRELEDDFVHYKA
jgi:hypothetical protein